MFIYNHNSLDERFNRLNSFTLKRATILMDRKVSLFILLYHLISLKIIELFDVTKKTSIMDSGQKPENLTYICDSVAQ